jgi:hypothetical protein
MIKDLLLDTHVLNEFIAQYFEYKIYSTGHFVEREFLTKERAILINNIIYEYRTEATLSKGIIVSSAISFIEIARKFALIAKNRYSLNQFKSFIDDVPPYFHIAPVEKSIGLYLNKVPKYITTALGELKPIELPDAIHCATYYSRDSIAILTEDNRIKSIQGITVI